VAIATYFDALRRREALAMHGRNSFTGPCDIQAAMLES
jgi:hypothetical protein